MQTTLIYNPHSGFGLKPSPEEIMDALRRIGHEPVYLPTSEETDLKDALEDVQGLVVIAGGDGTIKAVATRLLYRDVLIAPLPLGTVNNIARILGLTASPLEIIAGLAGPLERTMDVGRLQTPHGPEYFLEAMGIGIFADVLKLYQPRDGKSIPRGIQAVMETLNGYQPKFFHVNLDGEDLSGKYLLFEVMNTPVTGPRFVMAPDARPDDGYFDLVLIHEDQRESYLQYIAGMLVGNLEDFPLTSVIRRGRRLEIAWRGFPLHLDEEIVSGSSWTEKTDPPGQVDDSDSLLDVSKPHLQVDLIPSAIRFWVPAKMAKE